MTLNHLERIQGAAYGETLTEQDYEDSLMNSDGCESVDAFDHAFNVDQVYRGTAAAKTLGGAHDQGPQVKHLQQKSDQLFFEFFGMYTKESIKSTRQKGSAHNPR